MIRQKNIENLNKIDYSYYILIIKYNKHRFSAFIYVELLITPRCVREVNLFRIKQKKAKR